MSAPSEQYSVLIFAMVMAKSTSDWHIVALTIIVNCINAGELNVCTENMCERCERGLVIR